MSELEHNEFHDYKAEYFDLFNQYVTRPGKEKLLDWMSKTDFFTTPASTKYHCACPQGLVMHSISVFNVMMEKHFDENIDSVESFAITALLHDLCKANFYKVSTRNVKNEETGQWEKVPFYTIEDAFPYGHGEKSVFLIERFMRLKVDEAMAIRWHMGGFEESTGFTMSQAYEKYPIAVKLHLADLESTYLRERNTSVIHK